MTLIHLYLKDTQFQIRTLLKDAVIFCKNGLYRHSDKISNRFASCRFWALKSSVISQIRPIGKIMLCPEIRDIDLKNVERAQRKGKADDCQPIGFIILPFKN